MQARSAAMQVETKIGRRREGEAISSGATDMNTNGCTPGNAGVHVEST